MGRKSSMHVSMGMDVAGGAYVSLPTVDPGGLASLELAHLRQNDASDQQGDESVGLPFDRQKMSDKIREASGVEVPNATDSPWRFVEEPWFQLLAAAVILSNVVTTVAELDDPGRKATLFVPDQLMLCFYVVELICRACFFQKLFCCGPAQLVAWSVLDVIVVSAGVLDSWALPLLPDAVRQNHGLHAVLSGLRLLRLFRVLSIFRIFMEMDLSWTEAPLFQTFIGGVIAFNSLLMGLETDYDWAGWFYIENVLLAIYVFELSVRLKRSGTWFFSCNNPDIVWNGLDFLIVVSSTLDSWIIPFVGLLSRLLAAPADGEHPVAKTSSGVSIGQAMMLLRMLRLLRVLRLVKLVKSVQPLYILVTGVAAAVQGVMWVLVLVLVAVYAMAIIATRVIGHGMIFHGGRAPAGIFEAFKTVPTSMFTLFRCMSGASSESESDAIEALTSDSMMARFGFVFFMISSSWTLLSILTAVVSENMITVTGDQELEMKIIAAEDDRRKHIDQLNKLFMHIDASGNGIIAAEELETFLQDSNNRVECAKSCRLPARDVKEVLQTLHLNAGEVTVDDFVGSLADVSKPVTEKSMMKIEAMIAVHQRHAEIAQKAEAQVSADALQRVFAQQERTLALVSRLQSSVDELLAQVTAAEGGRRTPVEEDSDPGGWLQVRALSAISEEVAGLAGVDSLELEVGCVKSVQAMPPSPRQLQPQSVSGKDVAVLSGVDRLALEVSCGKSAQACVDTAQAFLRALEHTFGHAVMEGDSGRLAQQQQSRPLPPPPPPHPPLGPDRSSGPGAEDGGGELHELLLEEKALDGESRRSSQKDGGDELHELLFEEKALDGEHSRSSQKAAAQPRGAAVGGAPASQSPRAAEASELSQAAAAATQHCVEGAGAAAWQQPSAAAA